jgi:SAM-dependent methyltransferase
VQRMGDIFTVLDRVARLESEAKTIRRENASILRLLGQTSDEAHFEANEGAFSGEEPTSPSRHEASDSSPVPVAISTKALFAEIERGSRAEVISKLRPYLQHFTGKRPILDLGCGRGEFLELATQSGLSAYGVDTDPEAIQLCRGLGLDGRREEILEHLTGVANRSLGGVFCAQVVEHLPAEALEPLLAEIARVLEPGGVALIETPNPATFATHVQSFWRDPTHVRPVPEAALAFRARTAGLEVERVIYTSLPPEEDRLQRIQLAMPDPAIQAIVEALNRLVGQLNELLYGYQDYALVAVKPPEGGA